MHRESTVVIWTAFAVILLAIASSATAAGECQRAQYDAAARYARCDYRATGSVFSAHSNALEAFAERTSRCRVRYAQAWARELSACAAARFMANGDGTVTDNLTNLQWEVKTDDGTVHDKDNVYDWNAGSGLGTAADGSAFTSFLATLNSGSCFANQCDWRLPTRQELQSILLDPYPCTTSPCVDQALFGPAAGGNYWSSTTVSTVGPFYAWAINFDDGAMTGLNKGLFELPVRAVRGGL